MLQFKTSFQILNHLHQPKFHIDIKRKLLKIRKLSSSYFWIATIFEKKKFNKTPNISLMLKLFRIDMHLYNK